jgi:hypothetical protein
LDGGGRVSLGGEDHPDCCAGHRPSGRA